SRNTYLNSQERKAALVLSRAVALGFSMAENGERDAEKILRAMTDLIEQEPLAKIDYVKAVDASSITPVNEMTGEVLIAMAVYIGSTRLIDNFIYKS
ncbi:MAG: pantoate--beta-alanine ligase, partial [Oscillospiraceae bacterium]